MVFGAGHVRASRRSGWRPPSRSNAWRPCVHVGWRLRARLAVFVSRRSVAVRVEAGPRRPALAQTLLLSPEDGDQRRTRRLVLAVRLVLGHGRAAYRWLWLVMGRGRVGSSWPGSLSWPGALQQAHRRREDDERRDNVTMAPSPTRPEVAARGPP